MWLLSNIKNTSINTYNWDHLWQCVRRECAHTTIPTLTLHPSLITREAATLCARILSLWSVSAHHFLVLSTTSDLGSSEVLRAEEWERGNLDEEGKGEGGEGMGEGKEVREGKGRGEKRGKRVFSLLGLIFFLSPSSHSPSSLSLPAKVAISKLTGPSKSA